MLEQSVRTASHLVGHLLEAIRLMEHVKELALIGWRIRSDGVDIDTGHWKRLVLLPFLEALRHYAGIERRQLARLEEHGNACAPLQSLGDFTEARARSWPSS